MKQDASPKISIITCFLNVGNLLEEAIESVLKQEYTNWELWLVDDGSSDCSTGIAKKYTSTYPERIFYHEHEGHKNLGASESRNVAIKMSVGEYVAFLDGDDVWLPNLLSELVGLMLLHKPALVCEATEYWYSWNDPARQNEVIPLGAKQNYLHQAPQLMLDLYPLGSGDAPCICGMLVRKDALQKYGGFEASFKGMYDDQALLIKFYLNEKVYISSGCHNLYRQRSGSLVNSSHLSGNYHAERYSFLKWLDAYFKEKKINQPKVKKQLQKALFPYRYPFWNSFYQVPGRILSKAKKIIKR